MTMNLKINGQPRTADAAQETPLLWVLRDELGMCGTKFGCCMALCGACTVHLDGQPIRSCTTPVTAVQGKAVTTIEGMENDRVGKAVQAAWVELGVAQCGYCQAGQIMASIDLLARKRKPSDDDIGEIANLCRCGTYPRIRSAIQRAAVLMAEGNS